MRPLALLGGTFDPVHIAHLAVAWEASELLDADVRLMPAAVPPHRPPPVADATTRVALLRAALQGQDRIGVDTRELARGGPSYTVDTLAELREEVGERPLVLLLGADAFAGLPGWHHWHLLFRFAHIGVLSRAGHAGEWPAELAREAAPRQVADPRLTHTRPAGMVVPLEVTPLDISATRIRQLLGAGRDPRWLLPPGLLDAPDLLEVYQVAPQEPGR
jgi:nicotinate-nucleotide adenylyltransferase